VGVVFRGLYAVRGEDEGMRVSEWDGGGSMPAVKVYMGIVGTKVLVSPSTPG
jgi:hypothetical protein